MPTATPPAAPLAPLDPLAGLGIEAYLERHQQKELLRLLTCGSVDDGKSTLIGRLLHDTRQIYEDQLAAVRRDSVKQGTTGGASSQCEGKYERYFFTAAMHPASSLYSPSATPLFVEWIFEPPRSCSLMSSPVIALTSGGPPSAIEPWLLTMGTKSARPGM